MTITTTSDYQQAARRVRALADFDEGTAEAAELARLVAALRQWECRQQGSEQR